MPTVPAEETARRVKALQGALAAADPPLDAAVVIQSVDLYYLAGTIQTAHLLVPREGTPRLLVRKVLERAREDSPLEDIRPMTSLRALPEELGDLCGPPPWRLGFELDICPANLLENYRKLLGPGMEIRDVSRSILDLRAVKSDWELDRIRRAAAINDRLYRDLPELLGENLSTLELQAILDCRARTAGHLGVVRLRGLNMDGLIGVVVSGPSGAAPGHSQFPIGGRGPHPAIGHGGDLAPIQRDTPVIFDYLANSEGYHHDQTRMAVVGSMPGEAEQIFQSMRRLLRIIEGSIRPGSLPSRIYEDALNWIEGEGLSRGFLGAPGYAVGFVGHGVGLEVNETPVLARGFDRPLVEGNVLAIEPKFTHPEYGVIGIENTYVVRDGGAENLSISPEDVITV